jgi:hypothetical protein
MTHTPGNAMILANKASVALRKFFPFKPFEHRTVVLVCNGRLFGDEQNHAVIIAIQKSF